MYCMLLWFFLPYYHHWVSPISSSITHLNVFFICLLHVLVKCIVEGMSSMCRTLSSSTLYMLPNFPGTDICSAHLWLPTLIFNAWYSLTARRCSGTAALIRINNYVYCNLLITPLPFICCYYWICLAQCTTVHHTVFSVSVEKPKAISTCRTTSHLSLPLIPHTNYSPPYLYNCATLVYVLLEKRGCP